MGLFFISFLASDVLKKKKMTLIKQKAEQNAINWYCSEKSQDVSAPHIHKTVEKSWTEEGEVENYT